VTSELAAGLRALAEALPAGTAVPVPRELLIELLAAPAAPTGASANGAGKPDEQLLTVQEVAERFGLSEDWLYRHSKDVGGVKLGRKVLRFPPSAVRQYIATKSKAR
jgi:excisionase family DNA binding protein